MKVSDGGEELVDGELQPPGEQDSAADGDTRTLVVQGDQGEENGSMEVTEETVREMKSQPATTKSTRDESRTMVINEGEEQGGEEGPTLMKSLPADAVRHEAEPELVEEDIVDMATEV